MFTLTHEDFYFTFHTFPIAIHIRATKNKYEFQVVFQQKLQVAFCHCSPFSDTFTPLTQPPEAQACTFVELVSCYVL